MPNVLLSVASFSGYRQTQFWFCFDPLVANGLTHKSSHLAKHRRRVFVKRTILVAIFCAAVAMSGFAQNQNSCSPTGAWYGGSEGTAKYLGSITPIDGSTYQILFDGAYSTKDMGFPVKTIFAGTFKAQKHGQYLFEGTGGGFVNSSDAMPPATPPAIMVVHFRMRFEGCDTLIFDHDFFGGYFIDNGKVPFVDVPDFFPAPVPIHETYKRIAINCPLCTN